MKRNRGKDIAAVIHIFICAAAWLLSSRCAAASSPAETIDSAKLETIGRIEENLFHTQGISFSTDSIFISSVDSKTASAYIWKFDRRTLKLIKSRNMAEGFLFHPGGLQYDGKYLWTAIAVYSRDSSAKILKLDPDTLKPLAKFPVKDHIGLAVSDGDGLVYGGNWDAKMFYIWNNKGKLVEKRPNPTTHGYQDCKVKIDNLVCSGGGYVDFINRKTWTLEKSLKMPDLSNGNNATREGMDYLDGRFYFLPDDGAGTNIISIKDE